MTKRVTSKGRPCWSMPVWSTSRTGTRGAHRPPPLPGPVAAVLPGLLELAPLRHHPRRPRPRPHPGGVQLEGTRSRMPRPRRPPGPGVAALDRQDPDRAPRRPGRRHPPGTRRGGHRGTRRQTVRRRRARRRREAAVRVGRRRRPRGRLRLRRRHRFRRRTGEAVARAVRPRQDRRRAARVTAWRDLWTVVRQLRPRKRRDDMEEELWSGC